MRQSIKEKLEDLENQNQLLTSNLVNSIWVLNAGTLRYEYIAPPFNRRDGYTATELIGRSILEELAPQDAEIAVEMLETALDDYDKGKHEAKSFEMQAFRKNGSKYWVEIKAKLLEEPGRPLKIVGVTRDITARKTAELQMEKKNRELAAALAEKELLLKEIKVLQALLPVCSGCRRIRDESGKWWPLDAYIQEHTDSDFTHTICPDCKDVFYPGLGTNKLT